jgi:hypothetical protein
MPRVLLYTGKGGVGKTSVAAASALWCAERGVRTIVLSTDIAHSLADALDLPLGPEPREIAPNLWGQEPDVVYNVQRYWQTIQAYVSTTPHHPVCGSAAQRRTNGVNDIEPQDAQRRIDELEERLRQLERLTESRSRGFIRRLMPPEAAVHFRAAGREQLLGVRALVDHWIHHLDEGEPVRSEREEIGIV